MPRRGEGEGRKERKERGGGSKGKGGERVEGVPVVNDYTGVDKRERSILIIISYHVAATGALIRPSAAPGLLPRPPRPHHLPPPPRPAPDLRPPPPITTPLPPLLLRRPSTRQSPSSRHPPRGIALQHCWNHSLR